MINLNSEFFKDHHRKPLERHEVQFLTRVFSKASSLFFGLMVLFVGSGLLLSNVFQTQPSLFVLVNGCVMLVSCFVFFFACRKYKMDPLGVSKSVVNRSWISLVLLFNSIFLTLIHFAYVVLEKNSNQSDVPLKIAIGGLLIFGITLVLYTIPALIGFYIQNRKIIVSLAEFLRICFYVYASLFSVFFVCSILFWFSNSGVLYDVSSKVRMAMFVFSSIIAFLSPIITIYRMKTIAPHINYEDQEEVKRWQNFFVFEVIVELLYMAMKVARFILYILSKNSRSK